ncbi:hypothetical protein ACFVZ2_45045, partial [Streptomyces lasiicapitis]
MFRRNRADREFREAQRAGQAVLATHTEWPQPGAPAPVAAPAPAAPADDDTVVPDFLPPEFRAPRRQDVSAFRMRWDLPLVIDGEVH